MNNATSQIERHFQMHTVYKRGKKFLDIQKMNEDQHYDQIYRRMPNKSIQSLDTRVDSSFQNSADVAMSRLNRDISKKRKRYEETIDDQIMDQNLKSLGSLTMYSDADKSQSLTKKKSNLKGPDMNKMSPRKQFSGKKSVYRNEDQFNNYSKNPKSRYQSINFDLLSPRSKERIQIDLEENPQRFSTLNSARMHDRNSFNQTIMKCLFDLKKTQKKSLTRKGRTEKQTKPDPLPFERIVKAEKHVQKNPAKHLHSFYQTINRDTPSQLDMKILKNNEYYYEKKEARKLKQDFFYKKRINEMEEKRFKNISERKCYPDDKNQMCNYQYFLRKKLKSIKGQI